MRRRHLFVCAEKMQHGVMLIDTSVAVICGRGEHPPNPNPRPQSAPMLTLKGQSRRQARFNQKRMLL